MPRSASGQNCPVTINPGNSTSPVSPDTANPAGPSANLQFNLTGNYTWVSPYIQFAATTPAGIFGTPTLSTSGNQVTVSDANNDKGKYKYTIYYRPNSPTNAPTQTIDPDIQNSDSN